MQPLCPEPILVRQILYADRRAIGTCVGVGALHHLRLQVLVAQILGVPLRQCLLAIARRVAIGEGAVGREFIVVAGDGHLVPVRTVLKL